MENILFSKEDTMFTNFMKELTQFFSFIAVICLFMSYEVVFVEHQDVSVAILYSLAFLIFVPVQALMFISIVKTVKYIVKALSYFVNKMFKPNVVVHIRKAENSTWYIAQSEDVPGMVVGEPSYDKAIEAVEHLVKEEFNNTPVNIILHGDIHESNHNANDYGEIK